MRYTFARSSANAPSTVVDVSAPVEDPSASELRVVVEGRVWAVRVLAAGPPVLLLIDGRPYEVLQTDSDTYQCRGGTPLRLYRSTQPSAAAVIDARYVVAPMPGRVVKVACRAGDSVEANQPLVVLEAMKMENELTAPFAGRVERVSVEDGQSVERGARLVELAKPPTE